jgi:hypothetical protein
MSASRNRGRVPELQAIEHLTLAAEGGDAVAQYNLGLCFATNKGKFHSPERAVKWCDVCLGCVFWQHLCSGLVPFYKDGLAGISQQLSKDW